MNNKKNSSLFSELERQDRESFSFLLNVAKIENEEAKNFLKIFLLKDLYYALSCSSFHLDKNNNFSYKPKFFKRYCFEVESESYFDNAKGFYYKKLYVELFKKLKNNPEFDFKTLRFDFPEVKDDQEKSVNLIFQYEGKAADGVDIYRKTKVCNLSSTFF